MTEAVFPAERFFYGGMVIGGIKPRGSLLQVAEQAAVIP
jgi:hypothetical protein